MTRTPSFEQIVEYCVDDVTRGRATVQQCLDAWPEHRAELAPILEAATLMHAAPRVPGRAPNPARRDALMIAIGQTPQERRGWSLPRLPVPGLPAAGALRAISAAVPVLAVLLIASLLLFNQGTTPATAATLTIFDGEAESAHNGSWTAIGDGDRVGSGSYLRTAPGGYAMLTFDDGSTVSMDPGAELSIEEAAFAGNGQRQVVMELTSGRAWHDVAPSVVDGSTYEVHTASGAVSTGGAVFETALDNETTSVTTADGFVRLTTGDETVAVASGETAVTEGGVLTEHRAATELTDAIVVRAPFAATLFTEQGQATGVGADGMVVRQLRGVNSTVPGEQPQRFSLYSAESGTYTLLLERIGDGDGEVVVLVNGEVRRMELGPEHTMAMQIELRSENGRVAVTGAMPPEEIDPAAFSFRIVETDRTRSATPVPAPTAEATATPAASPTGTPTETQAAADADTATPGSAARPDSPGEPAAVPGTPATPGRSTPDQGMPGRVPRPDHADSPGRPDHAGTLGPPDHSRSPRSSDRSTPERTPEAMSSAREERQQFRDELIEAATRGDARALSQVIQGALSEGDPPRQRQFLGVIAGHLDHSVVRGPLRDALDGDPGLRADLERALDRSGPRGSSGQLQRVMEMPSDAATDEDEPRGTPRRGPGASGSGRGPDGAGPPGGGGGNGPAGGSGSSSNGPPGGGGGGPSGQGPGGGGPPGQGPGGGGPPGQQ